MSPSGPTLFASVPAGPPNQQFVRGSWHALEAWRRQATRFCSSTAAGDTARVDNGIIAGA
jgi:hypothetical protein